MMTEDDAKAKWCPFVRAASEPNHAANVVKSLYTNTEAKDSTPRVPHWSRCIGSECMAWRWSEWESRSGYCGLAGKQHD